MGKNSVYYEMLSFKEQEQFNRNYIEQKILQEKTLEEYLQKRSRNFQSFLQGAFVFDLSNEGHDYWMKIVNSERCVPNWVEVYLDFFKTDEKKIYIYPESRCIKLPMAFANTIADELMIIGLITRYIIPKFEKKEVEFLK